MNKIIIFAVFALLPLLPQVIFATELLLISNGEPVEVGEEMRVVVGLSPEGTLVHAAEAKITFDPAKLIVTQISTDESVINDWLLMPKFNNQTGLIEFSGGTANAFNGGWGSPIMLVTFKALAPGVGTITINDSNVYTPDGLGTAVSHTRSDLNYVVSPSKITVNDTDSALSESINQTPQNLQPQQSQHDGGMLLGSIIGSLLLLLVGFFIGKLVFVSAEGKVARWVPYTSTVLGLASIILFEFSLVPMLAVIFGSLTVKYSEQVGLGIVGIVLGLLFLVVNLGHALGFA